MALTGAVRTGPAAGRMHPMEPSTVASLFGLALIAGVAAVIASFFVVPVGTALVRGALPITAAVATGATLGSLYFSEVADFVPCKLCWFQRIAMYPLTVILILAIIWRDRSIFRYVVPVAAIGIAISAYHMWIQWFPEQSTICELNNPCSAKWVEALGVFTIPQMAGLSFALIITIGSMSLLADRRSAATRSIPTDLTGHATTDEAASTLSTK